MPRLTDAPLFNHSLDSLMVSAAASTLLLPSAAYEIYSSLQLSNDSPFAYGQSDTYQLLQLQEKLSFILGLQVADHPLLDLLNLPNQPHYRHHFKITGLIADYYRVRTYNHLRKLANNLNITLLSGAVAISLGNIFSDGYYESILPTKVIVPFLLIPVLLFILKSSVDHVEYRWEVYKVNWGKLPLGFKKGLIALRNLVDFSYNFGCGITTASMALVATGSLNFINYARYLASYKIFPDVSFWIIYDLANVTNLAVVSTTCLLPAFTYAAIQQIPSYKSEYDTAFVHKIKCSNQMLFQSARVYGALVFTLAIYHFFIFSNLPYEPATASAAIIAMVGLTLGALLGGIMAGNSAWMNYQERDPKKLSVIDDEVQALRQTLLDEERVLTSSYGAIELEETHSSSNPIASRTAEKPKAKTRNVSCWLPFWQSSDQKDNIKHTTLLPAGVNRSLS
jgi:hypothetical protein